MPMPPPNNTQVKTSQPDLKVQTVWDNVWGVVQVVFLPGGKVMTVHKPGELHVYNSVASKSQVRASVGVVFFVYAGCCCVCPGRLFVCDADPSAPYPFLPRAAPQWIPSIRHPMDRPTDRPTD